MQAPSVELLPDHDAPVDEATSVEPGTWSVDDGEGLGAALDAAGIGTWCWDLRSDEIVCSRRCRELFGFGASSPTFATFLTFVNPQHREQVERAVRKSLDGNGRYEVEYRVGADENSPERWISAKGQIERDRTGAPRRMVGVVQDVSSRRSAESQRDELRRQLLRVQEEERVRLARDLHDQAGQELARVLMDIDALGAHLDEIGQPRLRRLRDQVISVEGCLRRVAVELRPSALDELGLCPALREHAFEWSQRFGISATLNFRGNLDDLPDEVTITLYRIVQEGLTNVLKHATGATAVKISLVRIADLVTLRIADDGRGFDPAAPSGPWRTAGPALGLAGMRERLSLLGGELTLQSLPQGGTVLCAHIRPGAFGIDYE